MFKCSQDCEISGTLEMLSLEPKYKLSEQREWESLVADFPQVHFGHAIMSVLPHYGEYVRISRVVDK